MKYTGETRERALNYRCCWEVSWFRILATGGLGFETSRGLIKIIRIKPHIKRAQQHKCFDVYESSVV